MRRERFWMPTGFQVKQIKVPKDLLGASGLKEEECLMCFNSETAYKEFQEYVDAACIKYHECALRLLRLKGLKGEGKSEAWSSAKYEVEKALGHINAIGSICLVAELTKEWEEKVGDYAFTIEHYYELREMFYRPKNRSTVVAVVHDSYSKMFFDAYEKNCE